MVEFYQNPHGERARNVSYPGILMQRLGYRRCLLPGAHRGEYRRFYGLDAGAMEPLIGLEEGGLPVPQGKDRGCLEHNRHCTFVRT
jgi:hypothetical protein